ncbi:MAG: SufE family protein [Marinomonas sp.]|jgi:cysteine desulfuration protein SufE|uniref:SufE family protein n=1 Tax=unclassified Marinomonas TaxID=196814 RepID=UPI0005FA7F93|nr:MULTISPECIES: SufE family protein [unclassified Marinomonas]KJZ13564.1 Fe-S cluster assembly protein SufE [Marinomonas sp. S3726]KZM44349.1 Fe-S cluster assembly protein SufE [Marinomonas sp. SBI22]KZM45507.1 Fe-S cluster assembly protein SufE [Marinomonas sp. SBI8L]
MSLPSTTEIIEDLEFFDDWEDRYKYIIDLGKSLPAMDEALKTELRLVKGCQSSVWIEPGQDGERMTFVVDSDAIIVRGLLALVMAAYDNKTATDIDAFDIDAYFAELDLERHLSPTRGNGLKSIVARIQAMAKAAL